MTDENMNPRHYAKFRNREVIVLGHNAGNNACLVCDPGGLTGNDQKELRLIASSITASTQYYLIPLLRKEWHQGNRTDWFSHLALTMKRSPSVVFNVPIKDLEDMNPDQKAVFKGYKKPDEKPVVKAKALEVQDDELVHEPVKGATDSKLDDLNTKLDTLISVLTQKFSEPAAPKPARPRRAPAKKAE